MSLKDAQPSSVIIVPEIVDSVQALRTLLAGLPLSDGGKPCLYVDLEGNNLSRHGTISLLTILIEPRKTVHLVDVTKLANEAFTTASPDGRTLQHILESEDVIKVFFDIRNDSDALFSLFGIRVNGIEDLQLMELASRTFSKRCLSGLAKCIEHDARIGIEEKQRSKMVKERGLSLFDPARGGSYAVFDARPLSEAIQQYCVQDVLHMPALREVYRTKLSDTWLDKVKEETAARIKLSQSESYNGKGRHMALGPSEWLT